MDFVFVTNELIWVSVMDNYKFNQHQDCEYFPCHKIEKAYFNCLFCYCPLYALKDQCGGNPNFLEDGTKDCSNCTLSHSGTKGYDFIMRNISKILELGNKK